MTVGNSFRNSSNLAEANIYMNMLGDNQGIAMTPLHSDAQGYNSNVVHRYKQYKDAAGDRLRGRGVSHISIIHCIVPDVKDAQNL